MGSGVCDHHPNLGILCLPFHHPDNRAVKHHWRGLRFESAPFSKRLTAENTLYVSYSKSVLSHVEVLNAGQGRWRGRLNVTSAIETWGVPPVMEYIKVFVYCFLFSSFFVLICSTLFSSRWRTLRTMASTSQCLDLGLPSAMPTSRGIEATGFS